MSIFKLLVVSAIILFVSSHVNAASINNGVSGGITNLIVDEKVAIKV